MHDRGYSTIKATNKVSWYRIDDPDDWTDFMNLPLLGLIRYGSRYGLTPLDSPEKRRNDDSCYTGLEPNEGSVFVFDVAHGGLLLQSVAHIQLEPDYDYFGEAPVTSKGRCASSSMHTALLNGGCVRDIARFCSFTLCTSHLTAEFPPSAW